MFFNFHVFVVDFENLFRGLSQAGNLGGVEVVMSMEEIPHGGTAGLGSNGQGNNVSASVNIPNPHQFSHGEVFLSPMPWGGPPSADLLQNIVSSVIRQGLVPGIEGITLHIPATPSPSQLPQNASAATNSIPIWHPAQLVEQAAHAAQVAQNLAAGLPAPPPREHVSQHHPPHR